MNSTNVNLGVNIVKTTQNKANNSQVNFFNNKNGKPTSTHYSSHMNCQSGLSMHQINNQNTINSNVNVNVNKFKNLNQKGSLNMANPSINK